MTSTREQLSESSIIRKYFAPLASDAEGALDLTDDAALVTLASGQELVVTIDTVTAGIHFFDDDAAADIAHKALAVNLSDLAAKGAKPVGYLLSIALPDFPAHSWLEDFSKGLQSLQSFSGCSLLGGDTVSTKGPLTITITAFGEVNTGGMIKRSGASANDLVYVSGTIGDACIGLKFRGNPSAASSYQLEQCQIDHAVNRYLRPQPRLELIDILREYASAAMDVSDGLMGDFSKLCEASGNGGRLEAAAVPLSDTAAAIVKKQPEHLELLLTGGDDYEILATISEQNQKAFEDAVSERTTPMTRIGTILQGEGKVVCLDKNGKQMDLEKAGYSHF